MENPKVIVEAGASDGIDTLNFVQNFPSVTVFAAEPIKKQFDFLVSKFNTFSNIKISQVALSNKTESVNIFVGKTLASLAEWDLAQF